MQVRRLELLWQQKQIKAFLIEEFGTEKGSALSGRQEKMLDTLIQNTKNKSENQMKTLARTILPRIALYKCLSEEDFSEEDVYKYMRKYMLDKVAAKKKYPKAVIDPATIDEIMLLYVKGETK